MAKPVKKQAGNLFHDRETKLTWERYSRKHAEDFEAYNNFVNLWSQDRGVKEYITHRMPLADYLLDFIITNDDNTENLFYCTTKDDLVGVAYITSPMDGDNRTHIEYLVVNPRMQGKGIGTRMIKSIKNNPEYFASNHKGILFASVEKSNEASKRAFLKNGFEICQPSDIQRSISSGRFDPTAWSTKFTKFFFSPRPLVEDKDDENEL